MVDNNKRYWTAYVAVDEDGQPPGQRVLRTYSIFCKGMKDGPRDTPICFAPVSGHIGGLVPDCSIEGYRYAPIASTQRPLEAHQLMAWFDWKDIKI